MKKDHKRIKKGPRPNPLNNTPINTRKQAKEIAEAAKDRGDISKLQLKNC